VVLIEDEYELSKLRASIDPLRKNIIRKLMYIYHKLPEALPERSSSVYSAPLFETEGPLPTFDDIEPMSDEEFLSSFEDEGGDDDQT